MNAPDHRHSEQPRHDPPDPAAPDDPEQALVRRRKLATLGRCIEALPPDEWQLIQLHYLAEEPLERARKRLGLTRSKARTVLNRAIRRMQLNAGVASMQLQAG